MFNTTLSYNRILVLAAVLLVVTLGISFKTIKAEVVVFDTSIAKDATPAVLSHILEASNKPISEIRFEKGTYHFYPDKGLETFRRISNHGDVLVFSAFPLKNFNDLLIDGQGSTFIFHGRMIPFMIDHCNRIKIKNLSVDWSMTFHSEALIVANDAENNTFDLQISEAYPYEIRNDQLIFIKEYYEHDLGQTILFDPTRKAIAFNTEIYTPLTSFKRSPFREVRSKIKYKYKVDERSPALRKIGRENKLRAEEIQSGLVRIHNHGKKIPPEGSILVSKGEQGTNRIAPAISITNTFGLEIENVTVHHAGGMGLIAENSGDLSLKSFHVTPSQGRMVSTTADATHFVGCRGKVILKDCTFNNQLDDATNVHGSYQEIVDILDTKRIGVRIGHFQQQGFSIGRAKDTLGFVRLDDSFFPYETSVVRSIEKINGRYQIITFHKDIPESVEVGDFVENLSAYPELIVENCNISRNRARGLLISTPKKTLIKDNFFHTEMEAILIPVESSHWYESGNGTNITIENNIFQDCQHSGFNRGVIRMVTDDDNENIAFKNIKILNNTFNHFDNLILEIRNTENLSFINNTITNTNSFPMLHPQNSAFTINNSSGVLFNNNKYSGKAKQLILQDEKMPGVTFN